jgi:hypothetical protein
MTSHCERIKEVRVVRIVVINDELTCQCLDAGPIDLPALHALTRHKGSATSTSIPWSGTGAVRRIHGNWCKVIPSSYTHTIQPESPLHHVNDCQTWKSPASRLLMEQISVYLSRLAYFDVNEAQYLVPFVLHLSELLYGRRLRTENGEAAVLCTPRILAY